MTDMTPGLPVALTDVCKSYAGNTVLKGISLNIAKGSFCTFLGASGSGKSTLLKMIAGFESVDSGRISIGGRDMAGVPVRKRNIGMVFQNYALFPNMTVARNIAFGLETRRLPKAEIAQSVGRMLEVTGLAGLGERPTSQLSGGQQQRVALARALVINPGLLLMDEPLGALDRGIRQSLQTEIKNIQRQLGITVLFVTHDQEEALNMSDEIVIMKDGEIAQAGAPRTLYNRPASRFVGSFLGDCNYFTFGGVDYAVRPEVIAVGAAAIGLDHVFECILEEVIFLGSSVRLVARSGNQRVLVILANRADLPDHPVGTVFRAGFALQDASQLTPSP